MDRIEFLVDSFPKLRAESYHNGIPSISMYLKHIGFNSIEYEWKGPDELYVYSVSEKEYLMLVLKYG